MNNKQDFTQGSIFGKMIQFMFPILGALVLQAMYGAVDMLVVGHFGTNAGISAVSTGSSIMNLLTFVLNALATGVTILLGKYLGEKRNDQIGSLIGNAISFFLILAAILSVVLILFARPIAVLMQAPEEAVALTAQYIRICGIGFLFVVFYNLISCIFRGLGNSQLPLLFVAIACVVNIVGDLLLIAVFHLNVAGAAIATIAAQAVSVILSLVIIRRQKLPFLFSLKDIRFGKKTKAFVKVGAPLALQELLTNLTFLALCAFNMLASIFSNNERDIARAFEYLRGFAPEAIITSILFSFLGYYNGHSKSMFVMLQGLAQSFLIRLPMSYLMSIRPNASLTGIGLAAPTATVFGIVICLIYYHHMNKQKVMYV